jgi:hypothetical protein
MASEYCQIKSVIVLCLEFGPHSLQNFPIAESASFEADDQMTFNRVYSVGEQQPFPRQLGTV